jgi:hypothetical protein
MENAVVLATTIGPARRTIHGLAIRRDRSTGIRCLRICALAGHTGYIRVTLGTIENREAQGRRLWFRSARAP